MITTERLDLIRCSRRLIEAMIEGDEKLSAELNAAIAKNWLQFPEALPYSLKMIESGPLMEIWGMHAFLYRPDKVLIGNGGFKGPPDEAGMVEIGYAISDEYRLKGLATEAAEGMVSFAFSQEGVEMVDAHTLAEENASTAVLKKCGMIKIGDKFDEEDGYIWQWRITRKEFEAKWQERLR